jgi:phage baseplate assembly protein W
MDRPLFSSQGLETVYGLDTRVFPDLSSSLALTSDAATFVDSLARLLLTPPGSLEFHPNRTIDLRSYLNAPMDDALAFRIRSAVKFTLEGDERVEEAVVETSFIPETFTLKVRSTVLTAQGPFQFVVEVGRLVTTITTEEA